MGALTSYQMIRARYNWPTMRKDIREADLKCPICQVFGVAPRSSSLGAHLSSQKPGEKWVADLLYLPKDSSFELVLVLVDVCSRWAIARPVRSAHSEEVVRTTQDALQAAGVHFSPKEIVHDGGSEFKKVFEAACELLKIEDTVSVASRPMSHGIVEKFNHDICQLIGKRVYKDGPKALRPHQAK